MFENYWWNVDKIKAQKRQEFDNQEMMKQQRLGTALSAADASATSEAADYEAGANRETAARTNSLANRLATARRTAGGGMKLGMKRKGFSAMSAGVGLNRANAAGRLDRRKNELRTAATAAHYQDESNRPGVFKEDDYTPTFSIGAPIRIF